MKLSFISMNLAPRVSSDLFIVYSVSVSLSSSLSLAVSSLSNSSDSSSDEGISSSNFSCW